MSGTARPFRRRPSARAVADGWDRQKRAIFGSQLIGFDVDHPPHRETGLELGPLPDAARLIASSKIAGRMGTWHPQPGVRHRFGLRNPTVFRNSKKTTPFMRRRARAGKSAVFSEWSAAGNCRGAGSATGPIKRTVIATSCWPANLQRRWERARLLELSVDSRLVFEGSTACDWLLR